MKYIVIFHANLNYAYLTPERYEFVIRNSYELILDIFSKKFSDIRFFFEASGYTIEQIAQKTPDVLEKLKQSIRRGQCEFMGSPYAHPMLPNFPEADGRWSIRFSNRAYQKYLGLIPKSFWNPECGWRSFIPKQVIDCGYRNMIGDFEAYSRSLRPDGSPNRPEIAAVEKRKDQLFYDFSFKYDLPGTEKAIHFPFETIPEVKPGKLRMFLRTDRVAQFGVRYFMSMPGYTLEKYLALIRKYSAQPENEPEGALVIFADDAEYIGTNGWFKLKYQNQPDQVFEATPQSREKLIRLVTNCMAMGEFTTFDSVCNELPALSEPLYFDDDSAWHGASASTWADTPIARLLRPWQDLVRQKLLGQPEKWNKAIQQQAWFYLTNSYNSDGQWPPTLPEAPHIVHPYNYRYCFENLLAAEMLVGGIDRRQLSIDPINILHEILTPQQNLVLKKAEDILQTNRTHDRTKAEQAIALIQQSRAMLSRFDRRIKLLYPSDYEIHANALVRARNLVGGIPIENLTISENLKGTE
jgi:alpha-amylase/alpha-mannosidase (GH57 family)